MRTEFGIERSSCDCPECVKNCKFISGYLIPADLDRWIVKYGAHWSLQHLMASPGAKVLHNGEVIQVPTLVPLRKGNGRCVFLNNLDLCEIHEIAPFGCAFFGHEYEFNASEKSLKGLQAIMTLDNQSTYRLLWFYLWNKKQRAEEPAKARERMRSVLFDIRG